MSRGVSCLSRLIILRNLSDVISYTLHLASSQTALYCCSAKDIFNTTHTKYQTSKQCMPYTNGCFQEIGRRWNTSYGYMDVPGVALYMYGDDEKKFGVMPLIMLLDINHKVKHTVCNINISLWRRCSNVFVVNWDRE